MQGITVILIVMSQAIINVFSLSGADTLDYFFTVFSGSTTQGTTEGAADAGVFGQAYRLFLYCAFAIIFLSMLYQIFKAFFGPLVQAESPSRVVIKSIFFGVLVALTQNIVAMIFEIAQIPFDAIYNDTLENSGFLSHFFNFDTNITGIEGWLAGISNALPMGIDFWETIICIVLFFMLIKQFMMLTLEMAERYLILGILTIIGPLCIACGAVKGLEEVFKNWLSWLINGCIVLIFTTFFLSVFIANFSAACDVPYLLLWICWFKTGQKIDEHMNALGLKTAKTGGFGLDVMNAMAAGLPTAIGLANKAVGTNVPQSVKDIANGNWKPKGFMGLSTADRRVGDSGTGMIGAANKMFKKADNAVTGGKVTDALQKNSANISGKKNAVKEALGLSSGHGKNSGLSHEELQKYATGEKSINNLSGKDYQNVAKDLIGMKAGSDMTKALEDNNMNVSNLVFDKDGNMAFKATDDKGNMMSCALKDHPEDPKNMLQVTGDDGEQRGCAIKTAENPDSPLNLPFEGYNNDDNGDKATVAGASDDSMVAAESVADGNVVANANDANLSDEQRDFIESSGGNIPVSSENINDDNSLKKFDENGNEDANGHFIKADNGTEEGMLIPESAIQNANPSDGNNARIESGSVTADGQSASDFNQVSALTNEQIPAENVKETENPDNTISTSITDGAGTEYALSKNEDGTYTGTAQDGSSATFTDNGDGSFTKTSESKEFDQSKGISTETSSETISSNNVVSGSNGAPAQATDSNGVQYNLQDNGDGTFTGTNSAGQTATFSQNSDGSLTKEETHSYATDMNGEKFEVNSSSMHDSAKDISGASQNIDMSKEATRNENGTVSATNEAGQQVTMPATAATTTCIDSATQSSFEIDGNKGFRASIGNNGQLQVSAANADTGNYQNVSGASVNINGKDLDLSKSIQSHDDGNGNITYSAQDKAGNRVDFNSNDLEKAHITAGTTSLHTTRSADVMTQSGQSANTMNFRNENSYVARNNTEPLIVKSTDGQYFKATSSQRYDAYGNKSSSGEYMKTVDSNNIPSYVKVEQENGNIRSYKFGEGSNKMTFSQMTEDGNRFETIPKQDMNYTNNYRETSANEASTHFCCKGVNYEMFDSQNYTTNRYTDSTGSKTEKVYMPQHYVQIGDTKYPVDMEKATFTSQGRISVDSTGTIPIKENEKTKYVEVGKCEGYTPNPAPGTGCVNDYVKYKDAVNGSAQYFNTKKQNIIPTVANDSYYHGVRTDMELANGTSSALKDSNTGLPTGKLLYKNEGEEYILHPKGTNVSQCEGSWVTMPDGKNYFAEPSQSNYMNRMLYKMGYDLNNNHYSDVNIASNNPSYKLFASTYNIPGNAKNVTLSTNENGACIQYESGGKKYAITNLEANGFKSTDTISVKGNRNPIGYKYEVKANSSSPLSRIKNRISNSRAKDPIQRNDNGLMKNRGNIAFPK